LRENTSQEDTVNQVELERLVAERTTELLETNEALRTEIAEHRKSKQLLADQQRQLRRLANEITLVEERERRMIAADLHDGIGQSLAMIKAKIVDLQGDAIFSGFSKNLTAILGLLDGAIRATRSLTFEISSPVLYELGLLPAIRWLGDQFAEKHGLRVNVREQQRLPALRNDVRILLFKCVRELLTNVVKYAQATGVTITVGRSDTEIRITVEDNGRGFDTAEFDALAVQEKGFGLFSIRERLEQLEGRMLIDSAHGKGTRVVLIVVDENA
jgi:signal transduction histidine kinase